ncbi:hypothetical protein AAFF_G00167000 [Aldrovandia affinis]|uniref:Uncharacterized protein n=1 Tax=Aldrovandia affinis TaxID=143900 RepID=A0AAD7RPS3_9TELE|nr:hypothetical protein AAFF_G00167000 [Aldrovandia affinis]
MGNGHRLPQSTPQQASLHFLCVITPSWSTGGQHNASGKQSNQVKVLYCFTPRERWTLVKTPGPRPLTSSVLWRIRRTLSDSARTSASGVARMSKRTPCISNVYPGASSPCVRLTAASALPSSSLSKQTVANSRGTTRRLT